MGDHSQHELLDKLAESYGIAAEYVDIWGQRRTTAVETKRALLAAMGVCVDTAESLGREFSAFSDGPWRLPCDPVLVVEVPGTSARWSFRMPVRDEEDRAVAIEWEVVDESGTVQRRGKEGPGLAPAESRQVDGFRHARYELPVPQGLAMGYYDLLARGTSPSRHAEGTLRLILVPPRCHVPDQFLRGERTWGVAVQLYTLRSSKNWGVGDFSDLAELVEWSATTLGAGLVGVNPLHALKNTRPFDISPYSPDNRLFLNTLYIDVERVPDYPDSVAAQQMVKEPKLSAALERLRAGTEVDYDRVAAAKRAILETLFKTFRAQHGAGRDVAAAHRPPVTERGRAFETFIRTGGETLENYALFQALTEEMRRQHPLTWVWQEWPEPFRNPRSASVAAFRASHRDRVRFYQYLQWVASEQLRAVAQRVRDVGMPIGLYLDLALGSDRCGSEAWLFQDQFALGADCGAPPDPFSPQGQNWGLPPLNPVRLRADAYRLFIALLRQQLTYGGALRLDHVMALFRLFWIPRGMPATAGAYVNYPVDDLLGILALESVRHHAVIVGEDLGTVPESIRERLAAAGVLSYRVLYFERTHDGDLKPPEAYPEQALAVVTTHDLPTLAGFWSGHDLEVRARLGLFADREAQARAQEERQQDRLRMLRRFKAVGMLPKSIGAEPNDTPEMTPELAVVAHTYLARSPAWIVLASLDDMIQEQAQINVPGTVDSYPNWSRKLAVSLEDLRQDPRPTAFSEALRACRRATRS